MVTKGVQDEPSHSCGYMQGWGGGTSVMWNAAIKEWVFLVSYSTGLGLAISNDTHARPGTWWRIDPTTGESEPGFKSTKELPHPDLKGVNCVDGAIIRDTKNDLYQIILSPGSGSFNYVSTKDFRSFSKEVQLYNGTEGLVEGATYPTAVGTHGDALTGDGTATIYFGGNKESSVPFGRGIYGFDVEF